MLDSGTKNARGRESMLLLTISVDDDGVVVVMSKEPSARGGVVSFLVRFDT